MQTSVTQKNNVTVTTGKGGNFVIRFFSWLRNIQGTNVLATQVKFWELQDVRDEDCEWSLRRELALGEGKLKMWGL